MQAEPPLLFAQPRHWRFLAGLLLLGTSLFLFYARAPLIGCDREVRALASVPIYPHAGTVCGKDGASLRLAFETVDLPSQVQAFYHNALLSSQHWDNVQFGERQSIFTRGHLPSNATTAYGTFTQLTITIATRPTWLVFGNTLVEVTYTFQGFSRDFGEVAAPIDV
jgi:hypothetical protein